MKNKTTKQLLIVALLIAMTAAACGIIISHKAKTDAQKERTGETVTEQEEARADEEDGPLATVFFASDYQAEPGFDSPADTLRGSMEAAKADGKSIDSIVICGDYTNDGVLHDYQLSPDESIGDPRDRKGRGPGNER